MGAISYWAKKLSPITVLVKMLFLFTLGQRPMDIFSLGVIGLAEKSFFIIFFADFKICLGMLTYRTFLGCLCSNNHMSAVATFPNGYAALFKHCLSFNVVKTCTISFLV